MEEDNNKRPQLLSSGRDEARAHLARQIGRLLAHAWLQDHATAHAKGEPSADGVDGQQASKGGKPNSGSCRTWHRARCQGQCEVK